MPDIKSLEWLKPFLRNVIVISALLIGFLLSGHSQDHYWSQQYGGQATLTGGTAVVGVNDHSNIYYNPGALGFLDTIKITASTFAIGFEYLRLKNGAGNGLNLKSTRVNILPQLLAGTINLRKAPRLKLVFGLLTRSRTNIRLNQDSEISYDAIPGAPGLEFYKGLAEFSYSSVEQWSGIGLAYKLSKNWSVGISSFGSFINLDLRVIQNAQVEAVSNGIPYIATVNEYSSVNFNQVTQVFKVGVAARFKRVHLGMALTAPGIKIWGEGKLNKSFEVYNLNQNAVDSMQPGQRYPSFLISDRQGGLKSHYKIPLSASVGIKVLFPKFSLSASLEYFMGYKTQSILQGTNRAVFRPTQLYGGDTILGYSQLQTRARAVFNAGLGAEIKVKQDMSMLLGARTDFSNRTNYLSDNSVINVPGIRSPTWDYLYFSAGFSYRLSVHNLIVGCDYGVGLSNVKPQMFNLTDPQQQTFLHGPLTENMKTYVQKFNFLISYTYFFKSKDRKGGYDMLFREISKEARKNRERKALKPPAEKKIPAGKP